MQTQRLEKPMCYISSFSVQGNLMKLTISLVSPQTITGPLQEFDVQASRGCGLLFLFPTLFSLSLFFPLL